MKLNYVIPAGLQMKTAGSTRVIYPNGDGTFRAEHARTGAVEVLSYQEVLSYLRQPGTSTISLEGASSAAARIRQGGFHYRQQLSEALQDQIDLRKAIIVGVDHLIEAGVKVDNVASKALASSLGLALFGKWTAETPDA